MVQLVLQHLNIFSRPSTRVDGEEWEDVHEPEILLDLKVGASCLLFLLVALTMAFFDAYWSASFYIVMTLFSFLADAVYFNHVGLDAIDRLTATCGVVYMVLFSTEWLLSCDPTKVGVWLKLLLQLTTALLPFTHLTECRQHPVRSPKWRESHVMWHVTGTSAMILSIVLSQGVLDDLFDVDVDDVARRIAEGAF